eukprot:CAMPEP_0117469826 /NCGR_PEP_ID=MMETSP0784-20121206/6898_1 /TAXON_ID=39447 /ORGANISM="" /LENGTH=283 /DNA_ID=CAMNT_0005263891 /DNA_START=121 /DNA_END=972 /DNA_ORIENTATION=-
MTVATAALEPHESREAAREALDSIAENMVAATAIGRSVTVELRDLSGGLVCEPMTMDTSQRVSAVKFEAMKRHDLGTACLSMLLGCESLADDCELETLTTGLDPSAALVLTLITADFSWSTWEQKGAAWESGRYIKVSDTPDYSCAISHKTFKEGTHRFTCLLQPGDGGSGANCKAGLIEGDALLDSHPCDSKQPGFATCYNHLPACGEVYIKQRGQGFTYQRCGCTTELTITLNCEEHSVTYSNTGSDLFVLHNVPVDGGLRFCLCVDSVGDSWELLSYEPS